MVEKQEVRWVRQKNWQEERGHAWEDEEKIRLYSSCEYFDPSTGEVDGSYTSGLVGGSQVPEKRPFGPTCFRQFSHSLPRRCQPSSPSRLLCLTLSLPLSP